MQCPGRGRLDRVEAILHIIGHFITGCRMRRVESPAPWLVCRSADEEQPVLAIIEHDAHDMIIAVGSGSVKLMSDDGGGAERGGAFRRPCLRAGAFIAAPPRTHLCLAAMRWRPERAPASRPRDLRAAAGQPSPFAPQMSLERPKSHAPAASAPADRAMPASGLAP